MRILSILKDTINQFCLLISGQSNGGIFVEQGPVQATLSYIGGKYKALILWHLSGGKLRFTELRHQVGSATPKVLTQQLRELESQELIHREVYPDVPPKVEYSLTDTGRSLLPVIKAMRDWGASHLRTGKNKSKKGSQAL